MKRLKQLWNVYRAPIVCVLFVLAGLALVFQAALLAALGAKLSSPDWWVDNLIAVILFPTVTAILVSITQRTHQRYQREPHEGWKWRVTWKAGDTREYEIYWEDAQRYEQSQLEMWKAVKSIIGNSGRLNINHFDDALARGWMIDPQRPPEGVVAIPKTYVIDFTRMGDHFTPF